MASSHMPFFVLHGGCLWQEGELSAISTRGVSPQGRELQPGSLPASAAVGFPQAPPSRVLLLDPFEGSCGLPPPPSTALRVTVNGIAVAGRAAFLSITFHRPASLTGSTTYLAPGCTRLLSTHGWRPAGDSLHIPRALLKRELTRTQVIDPGTSGSNPTTVDTSRPFWNPGNLPDFLWSTPGPRGWAMVHLYMANLFPDPAGLVRGAFCRPPYSPPF